MTQLSVTDRAAKTRRQIELVDEQLTKEFSTLPASVVHREVATVSESLLADARSRITWRYSQAASLPNT